MAKWKRGGRRKRLHPLSIFAYVDDVPSPLGLQPPRPLANMDAAGAGAVLDMQPEDADGVVEEDAVQDEFLA